VESLAEEQREARILTDTQEEERVSLFTFLGLTGTGHDSIAVGKNN